MYRSIYTHPSRVWRNTRQLFSPIISSRGDVYLVPRSTTKSDFFYVLIIHCVFKVDMLVWIKYIFFTVNISLLMLLPCNTCSHARFRPSIQLPGKHIWSRYQWAFAEVKSDGSNWCWNGTSSINSTWWTISSLPSEIMSHSFMFQWNST